VESEAFVSCGLSRLDNLHAINGLPQIQILPSGVHEEKKSKIKKNYVALVCERTIPIERPSLFGEASVNF
jgi:hypothetical protein